MKSFIKNLFAQFVEMFTRDEKLTYLYGYYMTPKL